MAYQLTCKEDGTKFFFKTEADIESFKYVFADHWCNVSWEPVIKVDDSNLSRNQKASLVIDPKVRAEANLSWGFSLVKSRNIGLTSSQETLVQYIMEKNNKLDSEEIF